MRVRPATVTDIPAVTEVLTDAFADYAWTRWTVAADDHQERLRALHETYLSLIALPFGRVDVLTDESDERPQAVAAWIDTALVPDAAWTRVGAVVGDLAGDRASAARAAEAVLAVGRPQRPHVTLATVGVAPQRQGHGHGTAVLTVGLRRTDSDGVPTYVETSAEANVRLYQRLGFAVSSVVDPPGGGPRTWQMWREPGAPLNARGEDG